MSFFFLKSRDRESNEQCLPREKKNRDVERRATATVHTNLLHDGVVEGFFFVRFALQFFQARIPFQVLIFTHAAAHQAWQP
jgi:hypothetical protein